MPNSKFDLATLSAFTGSESVYRHGLVRNIVFTEGVKHLADGAGAYWLVDKVATLQSLHAVKAEEFQVWTLSVAGSAARLTCDDGDGRVIHDERIGFTDFPEPGVKLYFVADTIMLPSEY